MSSSGGVTMLPSGSLRELMRGSKPWPGSRITSHNCGPSAASTSAMEAAESALATRRAGMPKAVATATKSGKPTPLSGLSPTSRPKKLACEERIDR